MDVMLERDPSVVLLGEDIGYFGGVFRVTDGLQRKHGKHRVLDTPIAECGIIGAAIGMAVNGLRPVAEIQFADYIYPGYDQIVSELARLRYRSAAEFTAPVTIRTPCGGGIRGGQTHSQSPEAVFAHVSGLKVVMPSNPYDAKGLLIAAIEDDDPVLFFEPKRLYNGPFDGDPGKPSESWQDHPMADVPEGHPACRGNVLVDFLGHVVQLGDRGIEGAQFIERGAACDVPCRGEDSRERPLIVSVEITVRRRERRRDRSR
jgi:2-oxoisovalerate dehydrogenase E1 component beta subunit